jgi:hypothetical protein
MEAKARKNDYATSEAWLAAATDALREFFAKRGWPLPERIRTTIAFTQQGRKGTAVGECLPPEASRDGATKIIIRCDRDEPLEILSIQVHQLVHAATGPEHNQRFRDACLSLGLDVSQGLKKATPGEMLAEQLKGLVDFAVLGRVRVADRPAKQKTRMLKADCQGEGCGYTVRLASKWLKDLGAPHCPKHGAMRAHLPLEEDEPEEKEREAVPAEAAE